MKDFGLSAFEASPAQGLSQSDRLGTRRPEIHTIGLDSKAPMDPNRPEAPSGLALPGVRDPQSMIEVAPDARLPLGFPEGMNAVTRFAPPTSDADRFRVQQAIAAVLDYDATEAFKRFDPPDLAITEISAVDVRTGSFLLDDDGFRGIAKVLTRKPRQLRNGAQGFETDALPARVAGRFEGDQAVVESFVIESAG